MEDRNLLSGGVDTLNEIKESLLELQGYKNKYDTLAIEEEKLDKGIQSLEKAMNDEVMATTKKRKQEIENTFDKQLDQTAANIRKTKEKRDKKKSKKVSERILTETAALREENYRLKNDAKTLFKQKHVPSYINTNFYYALYYPKGLKDIVTIIITLLVTLLIIPCGIYFFLLPEENIVYLIITYIATVILFGGFYLFAGNRTKGKHAEDIDAVKEFRYKGKENKKKIAVIKRKIKRDRDESAYGLESYDAELSKLEKEAADIAAQKKEALLAFDNTTSLLIASEIKQVYEDKLIALKEDYNQVREDIGKAAEKVKALTIKIASEYEPILGKDLITFDRIEALINIIMAGNAETISEAIAFHKQNIS